MYIYIEYHCNIFLMDVRACVVLLPLDLRQLLKEE